VASGSAGTGSRCAADCATSARDGPAGDDPLPLEHHLQLLDDLAALARSAVGLDRRTSVLPACQPLAAFKRRRHRREEAGFPEPVPRIAREGWARFDGRAGRSTREPCSPAPGTRPSSRRWPHAATFLHGDWKLGTSASVPTGRTVLLDDVLRRRPHLLRAPAGTCINRARLPHAKEEPSRLPGGAERHGVDTRGGGSASSG